MASPETATSAKLNYECPHCGQTNHINADLIGQTVKCAHQECRQPFHVAAPSGRLLGRSADENDDDYDVESEMVAEKEGVIATMHPAMFGNHPLYFLGCLGLIAGGIVAALILAEPLTFGLGLAAAGAGVLLLISWWLQTRFKSVIVTTKRTIYRRGVFSKKTSEVQHDDVRNMQVDQNFFQRMLNVGHVAISSSGQDDMEIDVYGLKSPNQVVEIVRRYQ